jgi:hypothetical protein
VILNPPERIGYWLPEPSVNAVPAREDAPPPDSERLEWLLLTSLPVSRFELAATVVTWYATRWCIEVYFHVLKRGCQIKRLHLETEERRYLVQRCTWSLPGGCCSHGCWVRATPDMDCEIIFDPREWRAAYIVVKRCPPPLTHRAWAK